MQKYDPKKLQESSESVPTASPVVTHFRGNRKSVAVDKQETTDTELDMIELQSRLEALKEHIEQLPDADATRVVQLHNRIQAGDYEIDAQRIAEKLLDLESSLD